MFTAFLGQVRYIARGPAHQMEFQGSRTGLFCCSFPQLEQGKKCHCHQVTRQGPAVLLGESCISGPFANTAVDNNPPEISHCI